MDLFSGIGGFSLAAKWVWRKEHEPIFCEIDEFCCKVLRRHWCNAEIYRDIKFFDGAKWRGTIDLLTAGVPCQPSSIAGGRKGTSDDRWLWPEVLRVMEEVRARWCIFENPDGILSLEQGLVFGNLLSQMEDKGYETQAFIIPACGVGAPHRRNRVWIIAYNEKQFDWRHSGGQKKRQVQQFGKDSCDTIITDIRCEYEWQNPKAKLDLEQNTLENAKREESSNEFKGYSFVAASADNSRPQKREMFGQDFQEKFETIIGKHWQENWYEVATRFCRVDDGIPAQLDKYRTKRLKALGNAIVPQVVQVIMQAIKETDENAQICETTFT